MSEGNPEQEFVRPEAAEEEATQPYPHPVNEGGEATDLALVREPIGARERMRRLPRWVPQWPQLGGPGGVAVDQLDQRLPWYRQPRWMRAGAAALLAVLLLTLVGVVLHQREPTVYYSRVKQGNLTLSFATTGTLQSASYDASFAASGKVAEVDVKVGDQVNAGDTLAKLDTTALDDAVAQAQAAIVAAQANVTSAQSNQASVQSKTQAEVSAASSQEQAALEQCQAHNPPSQSCIQAAQDAYSAAQARADSENTAAQAQVDAANAQLAVAQAQLKVAQDNQANATLTAPHDGTVANITGTVGMGVSPTTISGSTFSIRIVDLNTLQVVASVTPDQVAQAQKNKPARITVPSAGKRVFNGQVSGVAPIGQRNGKTLTYPLIIDVDTAGIQGAALLPGMSASVSVITQQRIGVPLIPKSALTFAQEQAKSGGVSRAQVANALKQARQLLVTAQAEGKDFSQDAPAPAYAVARAPGRWVTVPLVVGLTDGTNYEALVVPTTTDQVATGERSFLGIPF